jgi:type IV pilus assembly protein PilW
MMPNARPRPGQSRGPSRPAGFSLIELMVALTIGLVMIAGAGFVFAKSRDIYRTMETTARLQENARYAMSIIETDVRMANFWGLLSYPDLFTNSATAAVPFSTTVSNNCGSSSAFVTDVAKAVEGTNNSYSLSCTAYGNGAASGADVLIVRRASTDRIPQTSSGVSAENGRLLVESSRTQAELFLATTSGAIPAAYAQSDPVGQPPLADTRRLIVNAYYVSADSSVATGYPSLRRKTLISGPGFQDEEIIPGVEDLQVQLGVDVNDDRNADVFVNPGSVPSGGVVVAARIWLRVRAQDIDVAHVDSQPYVYADRNQAAPNDQVRRLVVMQTIQFRNTRT